MKKTPLWHCFLTVVAVVGFFFAKAKLEERNARSAKAPPPIALFLTRNDIRWNSVKTEGPEAPNRLRFVFVNRSYDGICDRFSRPDGSSKRVAIKDGERVIGVGTANAMYLDTVDLSRGLVLVFRDEAEATMVAKYLVGR